MRGTFHVMVSAVIALMLAACDSESSDARAPRTSESVTAPSSPTSTDAPSAEEIVNGGDFVEFEVLADGSLMTVWCTDIHEGQCLVAFRIERGDGTVTYGRLPGYPGSVREAGNQFLVDVGGRRHGFVLIDRHGRKRSVRFGSPRPIAAGDVLVQKAADAESAIVIRPADGIAFVVRTPGTNRLALSSNGTLWGASAAYRSDLEVRWRGEAATFRSYTYDRAVHDGYGTFHGEVIASGTHAAVFSCGDVASGQTCDHKFAVTADGGETWLVRDFASLPFTNAGNMPGRLAVAGETLVVAEDRGYGRGTVLWRSTNAGWTTFDKLASFRGTMESLDASQSSVWTYRLGNEWDADPHAVRSLLRIDMSGDVRRVAPR